MRRFLALLICLTMLLPLVSAPHRVYAADSYLITVAEDTVLQNVSDNGMAVYMSKARKRRIFGLLSKILNFYYTA